jgi:hypothetical protein
VLFVAPSGVPEGWERSDTWARAAEIPGVEVIRDPRGALAARFGATVSGHTVVYDAAGHLVFQGGITPARGHEGDNVGRSAIVAMLGTRGAPRASTTRTPTFGCELAESSTQGSP